MNTETRNCQNCKKDFTIDSEDFNFYEKVKVPPPTFCPMCRAQRRWLFRNERGLYKRKCDYSGKEIFSMYAPESPVKVYDRDIWISDVWDAMDYGKEIDWSQPFLTQMYELMLEVPFKSVNVIRGVGSPYVNNATDPKNCYLTFGSTGAEDCMYSNSVNATQDCVDVSHVSKSQSCYQSFWVSGCYRTHFSSQCVESSDLWFCRDCQGCLDCFGSVNLRNKSHYFFNQKCTKEEYDEKVKAYQLHTREGIEKGLADSQEFWNKFPNKNHQGVKNENSTGSYVTNSKNVQDSFLVRESENCRYCQYLQETPGSKDCYDYSNWGDAAELVYESISCGSGVNNLKFAWFTQESSHNTEYTMTCRGSENIFGCIGLKKKQYCILNKQYSKEEYNELVPKIIAHMNAMPYVDKTGKIYKYGEFFPGEFSPWAYNETIAQEYFPLTKEEALAQGYRWKDMESKDYQPTIKAEDIPNDISRVEDTITKEVFECAHKMNCNQGCTKAFRILPNELNFYRKIGVPLPTLCPACRTMERLKLRLGINLYDRKCMCAGSTDDSGEYKNEVNHFHGDTHCGEEFKTGFPTEKQDIVYCEKCYQQEVY
ncbi:MAG: hypothetical protein KBC06_00485 [Candidatus Pacebacteria bacterium]|nr:hypothetical protein [Candidatus Paceibacterota bacterium]